MPKIGEAQLRKVLEEAAAKLHAGGHVDWPLLVTELLRLPVRYIPEVQMALAQGRWRTAQDPTAYLRRVARREAAKVEAPGKPKDTLRVPANLRQEDGRRLSLEQYMDYLCYDYGPVREGGVWRARTPFDEALCTDDEGRVVPTVKGRALPEDVLMLEDDAPDAKLIIDWDTVGERAGLDAEETELLWLRGCGCTRDVILQQLARNDEERRGWQAAWRRLERHMDRVRAVLSGEREKNVTKNVPKTGFARTK
jgi:hypothetical protein